MDQDDAALHSARSGAPAVASGEPASGGERGAVGEPDAAVEPVAFGERDAADEPAAFVEPASTAEPAGLGEPAVLGKPAAFVEPAAAGEPAVLGEPAAFGEPEVAPPVPSSSLIDSKGDDSSRANKAMSTKSVLKHRKAAEAPPALPVGATGAETGAGAAPKTALSSTASLKHPKPAKKGFLENFAQQKLRAWQPVLTPKWIVSVFIGFGLIFIGLGILFIITSNGIVECSLYYEDPEQVCPDITKCTTQISRTIDSGNCVGPVRSKIEPPVYVYYQLTNYFQNHRRYVKSRNDDQLRGQIFTNPSDLDSCDPIVRTVDNRVYHPCGLIAWSVFNDSFAFNKDGSQIPVRDDPGIIAWSTDVDYKFKNPDKSQLDATKVDFWLSPQIFPRGVEDGHFIVWMRNAALPTFRKLWGKIDSAVDLPITVTIANRYPVAPFRGTKSVILSTTSWLGGRNSFLGISYLVIGSWCFLFGLFFVVHKYRNPRILGDVRYLNFNKNK